MKILVLTKNNPIEIMDITNRIRQRFMYDDKKFFCDSPQIVALELEQMKGIPYTVAFYPAIKVFENRKDMIYDVVDVFITVGTTDKKSVGWYDVIVGLNNFDFKDYKEFDTSIHSCECFTLKDSDMKFDEIGELLIFLSKMVKLTGEK
jgi:hypothetical protein